MAGESAWTLFKSLADWELSRWLVQSGVSQREIDKFLKLKLVCTSIPNHSDLTTLNLIKIQSGAHPSTQSKHTFFKEINSLPKGPKWMCETFKITGDRKDKNGEPVVEEVELWRRDLVECM